MIFYYASLNGGSASEFMDHSSRGELILRSGPIRNMFEELRRSSRINVASCSKSNHQNRTTITGRLGWINQSRPAWYDRTNIR